MVHRVAYGCMKYAKNKEQNIASHWSLISTKSFAIVLGISLCGVSTYLLYLLFKKDDDDYKISREGSRRFGQKIIEFRIPKASVSFIIGRKGTKINQIQEQTSTRIDFKNVGNPNEVLCIIKGSNEACLIAEHLIQEFVTNQPVIKTEEVSIPQNCVGKLIGRCGENINELTRITEARINVLTDSDKTNPMRRVLIKGTQQQIKLARTYLEDLVRKYQEAQLTVETTLAKREPRGPQKASESPKRSVTPMSETFAQNSGNTDTPFEVYVSAMLDPSRFWVQIISPKAAELDQLVDDMTEFYRTSENQESHTLEHIDVGDVVAATFPYDEKWYRAEVLKLITDGEIQKAELYYVDYGDSDVVECKHLYELPSNFLTLHFQAIECFLAKIEPIGDSWSEDAIDKFEEWTYTARWHKLTAKISEYETRERTRAKRGGSPVPGIDLYDMKVVANEVVQIDQQQNSQCKEKVEVNIADELVKHGYAVYKKSEQILRLSPNRTGSSSNISLHSSTSN